MRPMATRPTGRSFLIGLGGGLLAALMLLIAASLAVGIMSADRVMPGVRVAGVDVGGLDRAAVEARLGSELPSLSTGSATVVVEEIEERISYRDLGRRYELAAMVDAAFSVARDGDPLTDGISRLRALVYPTTVAPVVHAYDEAAMDRVAVTLSERAEVAPVDATIVRDGARFDVTAAIDGRTLDPADVRAALATSLALANPSDVRVAVEPEVVPAEISSAEAWRAARLATRTAIGLRLTIPGAAEDPELHAALTLGRDAVAAWVVFDPSDDGGLAVGIDAEAVTAAVQALAAVIDQEAVGASFSVAAGGLSGVIPGQDGRQLLVQESADALVAALQGRAAGTPTASLALNVNVTEPALTTAEAEAAFPQMQVVSSWTTTFVPGISNGFGANILIPARDIDGTTVAPGDWFSFWGAVGPVTTARGYTYGGAIINGRSEPQGALAGGICSTSTTLFNAAMRAGLEIGERENHYYYINRYPVGLDATVFKSDGLVQDLTFRNDTDSPVVVRGFGSGGQVTFQIWSVPTGRTVALSAPYVTDRRAAIDTTQVDPTMAPGTSRRIESVNDGFNATITRTVRDASGNVIHQNTWFSDYRPVNGIVLTGPAAAAEAPPTAAAPPADATGGTAGGGITGTPTGP